MQDMHDKGLHDKGVQEQTPPPSAMPSARQPSAQRAASQGGLLHRAADDDRQALSTGRTEPDDDAALLFMGEDEAEILQDVAGFADRDQLFGADRRQLTTHVDFSTDDEWPGEDEQAILGTRDVDKDLLDEIAETRNTMSNENIRSVASPTPWPVPPRDHDLGLENLSEHELRSRAQALGIADASHLGRSELELAIRQTLLDSIEGVIK